MDQSNKIRNHLKKIKETWQKIKRMKAYPILSLLLALVISGGIGVFVAVGQRAGDPKTFASEYFESFLQSNWDKMLSYVSYEKSDFVDPDAFKNLMQSEVIYGGVSHYKIKKTTVSGKKVTIEIEVEKRSDGTKKPYKIVLEKQMKRVYLFFPTWKVSFDDMILNACTIQTPVGTEAFLDGESLQPVLKGTSEDGTKNIYQIDRMFKGSHNIMVTSPYTDNYTIADVFQDNNMVFDVPSTSLMVKSTMIQDFLSRSNTVFELMYSIALQGDKTIEDLKPLVSQSEATQASVSQSVDALKAAVHQETGATLNSVSFDNVSTHMGTYTFPNVVEIQIDYAYTFEAKTGRTLINGVQKTYNGQGNASASVTFTLENDVWNITGINLPCLDYSKTE